MTNLEPPQPQTWKTLQSQLRPTATGERHPFFRLADLGQAAEFFVNGVELDATKFHGQYSLLELDVLYQKQPFRLAVSGTRLAAAIAAIEPMPGDRIELAPTGAGKDRTWTAKRL